MSSSGGANEGNRPSANSESGIRSGSKQINKNAFGNKSDVAWSHGTCIDGNARKIICNYHEKVKTGSIYRAGAQKDVGACRASTDEAEKEMWDIVVGLQQNLIKKTRDAVEEGGVTNNDGDY